MITLLQSTQLKATTLINTLITENMYWNDDSPQLTNRVTELNEVIAKIQNCVSELEVVWALKNAGVIS